MTLPTVSKASGSPVAVSFAGRPKGQVLTVTVRSARVSVSAQNAPLADVVAAIGRQAGFNVVLRDALTTSVTGTLINVPVDEAIRRLGRRHSIVLIYDRSTEHTGRSALTEVWVASPDPSVTAGRLAARSQRPPGRCATTSRPRTGHRPSPRGGPRP